MEVCQSHTGLRGSKEFQPNPSQHPACNPCRASKTLPRPARRHSSLARCCAVAPTRRVLLFLGCAAQALSYRVLGLQTLTLRAGLYRPHPSDLTTAKCSRKRAQQLRNNHGTTGSNRPRPRLNRQGRRPLAQPCPRPRPARRSRKGTRLRSRCLTFFFCEVKGGGRVPGRDSTVTH
jgi:hypothetical protein